jgi:hypothetical protein
MKTRKAAIVCAILGVIACPLSVLLYPISRAMGARRLPDGSYVPLSSTTASGIVAAGVMVAFLLIGLAVVLFARADRCRK